MQKSKKSKNGHFWVNFGYVSHIPAIRFWCHCTYRTLIRFRMTLENFVWIVWTVFEKIEKVKKWLFFGHFWANFGYVSHIPAILFWSHCTNRTLIWRRMTVENFVQIEWTLFEEIEKSRKMAVFGLILAVFGLILAMFLTFQSYDFDAFEHAGAPWV